MEKNYKAKGYDQEARIENMNIEIDHLVAIEETSSVKI